jgi:predicted NAD/FAD-binding protein
VLCIHGDEILRLFENPLPLQTEILSGFSYSSSTVTVHKDTSSMPINEKNWASWNYTKPDNTDNTHNLVCTYWPKSLQKITEKNVFVSLNHPNIPKNDLLLELEMRHPKMNALCIKSQKDIQKIQGNNDIWYAGAYLFNGFHEDGYVAGMNVAKNLYSKLSSQ